MSGIVILVVEDEPLLRCDAVDMLATAGYTVLDAENADQALKILDERSDIRVIFTDINMPGSMDGLELVELVGRREPIVLPIVTSGMNIVCDADLPNGGCFIPKPYSGDQILTAIQRISG